MFKKRPKARIKIGKHFLGKKISATAEGYILYEQWHANELRNYYWEEWELRGFNNYDSWLEYDHYSRKLKLYEPIKLPEDIDASSLKKGDYLTVTINGTAVQALVREAGVGTAIRREGSFTYHVFPGDKVAHAELSTRKGVITIENYNAQEKDYYKTTVLNRKKQKELLGRVVTPINWGNILIGGFAALVFGSILAIPPAPEYDTYCTPRSVSEQSAATAQTQPPSGDEIISQDDSQTCYRRTIHGGGGGGIGK